MKNNAICPTLQLQVKEWDGTVATVLVDLFKDRAEIEYPDGERQTCTREHVQAITIPTKKTSYLQ
jgi:hypothetical protein